MDRRSALRTIVPAVAALLGGCLDSLPGATGPRNPPSAPEGEPRQTADQPALAVDSFDFERTEEGTLRVFGTVENRRDVQRTATVRVIVTADGDEFIRETDVTVDAGETTEWAVSFDVAYNAFTSGGDLNVELA
ncbi:transcriptional initiation protein Tat [Halobellus ordinarius]|uniref:transcriptional initiation protein Tat n=1 Tax=Halobellus ordinarius TaxID=3075120 RepID=UPI0028800589|nr:transcriptional initiation protein Tat [Halobellus sp. ZY16]